MKPFVILRILHRSRFTRNLALCSAAIANLVAFGFMAELTKSEWSNWVQALGSIAALLAAFAIATQQHRDGIERDRIAASQRKIDLDDAVKLVVAHAFSLIYGIPGRRKGRQDYELHSMLVPRVTFRNMQVRLTAAPLYEVSDRAVVGAAMRMLDLLDSTISLLSHLDAMTAQERMDRWQELSLSLEDRRQRAWIIHQNLNKGLD